jgi:hypothetical protein
MEIIVIETEGKTLEKIKEFLKEINVNFKIKTKKEKPYDPEFVKMVLNRFENAKNGNVVKYTPEIKQQWFGK